MKNNSIFFKQHPIPKQQRTFLPTYIACMVELRTFGVPLTEEWLGRGWCQVIAEKRGTFSGKHNPSRPMHTTPLANILQAGDYTAGDYPATLAGAVVSGLRCAGKIAHHSAPAASPQSTA